MEIPTSRLVKLFHLRFRMSWDLYHNYLLPMVVEANILPFLQANQIKIPYLPSTTGEGTGRSDVAWDWEMRHVSSGIGVLRLFLLLLLLLLLPLHESIYLRSCLKIIISSYLKIQPLFPSLAHTQPHRDRHFCHSLQTTLTSFLPPNMHKKSNYIYIHCVR